MSIGDQTSRFGGMGKLIAELSEVISMWKSATALYTKASRVVEKQLDAMSSLGFSAPGLERQSLSNLLSSASSAEIKIFFRRNESPQYSVTISGSTSGQLRSPNSLLSQNPSQPMKSSVLGNSTRNTEGWDTREMPIVTPSPSFIDAFNLDGSPTN